MGDTGLAVLGGIIGLLFIATIYAVFASIRNDHKKINKDLGFKATLRMRLVWFADYFLSPVYLGDGFGGWFRFLITGGAVGFLILATVAGFNADRFNELFPRSHVLLALTGYPVLLLLQQIYWAFRKNWKTPLKYSWDSNSYLD
jgi:hypothetical protein